MEHVCLVCGYDGLFESPYTDGIPSDEICPCCGFHFGYDDDLYKNKEKAYVQWRTEWIKNGCRWFSKGRRPPGNWDPKEQMKHYL